MADSKISALPASTVPLAGTEVLPIVQSSATKQVTVANLTAGRAVSALSLSSATIGAPASTTLNLQANGTTYATILGAGTNNGFFGLGTTSPSGKLTVANTYVNTSDATIVASSNIPGINLRSTSTGRFSIFTSYSQNNSTSFLVGTGTNNPSTEAIFIDHNTGNVSLGNNSPSASAALDVQSTTKGVRMPNMTTTQKNAIASPAAGLMVFDTTLAKLCVYSGAAWQTVTSIQGTIVTTFNWTIVQMDRLISDGFVVVVHYNVSAVDDIYTAGTYGTTSYTQEKGISFVPYDQLTQDIVVGWVQEALGKDTVEASLQSQIDALKNPVQQFGLPWNN